MFFISDSYLYLFQIVFFLIITDINKGGLLKLIKGNILRNKHLTNYPITVLELDFMSQVLPREIVHKIEKIPIVIAADGNVG